VSEQVRRKLKAAMQENARLKAENEKYRRCFQGEKDWVLMEPGEHARLKAEVERLKAEPDALTAYLYADTLRREDIKTLKAHIELLTYVGDAMAMMVGHIEVKGDAHRMMLEFSNEWNAAKEGKQS